LLDDSIVAKLGTVLPDGQPQVHPVWFDTDGDQIRINTARGRQKDENLKERKRATVLLIDPDDQHFWLEIRGKVVEAVTGPEAEAHIDQLAQKYMGAETYPYRREGEVRVMYVIEPDRIVSYGG
jgi:PPOX class probable F420-dependent enzyme